MSASSGPDIPNWHDFIVTMLCAVMGSDEFPNSNTKRSTIVDLLLSRTLILPEWSRGYRFFNLDELTKLTTYSDTPPSVLAHCLLMLCETVGRETFMATMEQAIDFFNDGDKLRAALEATMFSNLHLVIYTLIELHTEKELRSAWLRTSTL